MLTLGGGSMRQIPQVFIHREDKSVFPVQTQVMNLQEQATVRNDSSLDSSERKRVQVFARL